MDNNPTLKPGDLLVYRSPGVQNMATTVTVIEVSPELVSYQGDNFTGHDSLKKIWIKFKPFVDNFPAFVQNRAVKIIQAYKEKNTAFNASILYPEGVLVARCYDKATGQWYLRPFSCKESNLLDYIIIASEQ